MGRTWSRKHFTPMPVGGVKHTIGWFMNFTSIGGISQFHKTDLVLSKVIWIILFLFGSTLTYLAVSNVR